MLTGSERDRAQKFGFVFSLTARKSSREPLPPSDASGRATPAPLLARFQFATCLGLLGAADKEQRLLLLLFPHFFSGTDPEILERQSYDEVNIINVCWGNFFVVKFNPVSVCGAVHSDDEAGENSSLLTETLARLSLQARWNIPCYGLDRSIGIF